MLYSQRVLLDKDVTKAYKNIRGPNTKSFKQLFIGTGVNIPGTGSGDAEINLLRSGSFMTGFRQKFKVAGFYSAGYELGYSSSRYNIRQVADKAFPTAEIHDNEKIRLNALGLSVYNRINIGKQGNIIGKFIDLGAYVNLIFRSVHITRDKLNDPVDLSEVTFVKNARLKYPEQFQYGVYARLGINWIALKTTFRLSDMFKNSYDFPELSRLQIGLEVTLPN